MLKMSLGGKGVLSIKPSCCCYYSAATYRRRRRLSSYNLSSSTNIQSVSCCLDSSPHTVYLKSKLEQGTEEGFNTDDNKEMLKQSYKKGDIINLPGILFTKHRDYLVKNNSQQVKAKQLEGKVIVIFFVPISGRCSSLQWLTLSLMEIHSDCKLNNNFEVVSVPVGVDPSLIGDGHSLKSPEDLFSLVPWPSIPISDITSRKCLQRSFGVSQDKLPVTFIIDPTGRVLQTVWYMFDKYGALGYPFSDERINFLKAEDEAIAKKPSLKALLASPQRDYLISSDGEEVPIHNLEDKVVVLLFYEEGLVGYHIIEELRKAYQRFAKVEHNFEVVLIYQSGTVNTFSRMSEKLFWATFKTMPWLALPFNDPSHKKLRRIFEHSFLSDKNNPLRVVIFGPRGEFIEPFGTDILCTYGIEAFPFTRMEAAKLETEKVKELQLGMLWDQNTVFRRKDGSEVRFSQLSGKQVMLYFERAHVNWGDIEFLQMLKEMYFTISR